MNLSVFGLGKLGTPLAAILAAKGHTVTGVDVTSSVVDDLCAGRTSVEEPGLLEAIEQAGDRLSATTNGVAAAVQTDASFLIVPTPSEESGNFSLDYILPAARQVGKAIGEKTSRHVVVITSTVVPGATNAEIIPAIEEESGKVCGVDFGVCYSPEFVALGNVVQDMLAPDIVLIGESDQVSGDCLEEIYASVNENSPAVERMNIVNAEVTKLAVNTYVTTKISFANMLSDICQNLEGGDAYRVADAIGSDSRIGKKYIRPGIAYGGPCFPRDNKALAYLARNVGADATIATATDDVNRYQNERMKNLVAASVPAGGAVAILGLSYKPGTGIVDEAAGMGLASHLNQSGFQVSVYDPQAMKNAKSLLKPEVRFADSMAACVQDADAIVITTSWPEFETLGKGKFLPVDKDVTVIDGWNLYQAGDFTENVAYIVLGRG